MEPEDEEGHCALEEVVQPVVKKRGRGKKKKKVVEEVFLSLPDEAIADLSPDIVEELQTSYKILQTLMGISKIQPFLDKPNENLFGMSSYYNIIRSPMWFREVERKLFNKEYDGIAGFVADIRLILENCYRFWGPTHKFSRKALFIEHKLELKLSLLPQSVQAKCVDPEELEIKVEVEVENLDDFPVEKPFSQDSFKESVTATQIKGFESKILNRVLESDDLQDTEDIEEQNRKEEEMLNWERECLVSEIHKEEINSMWQLAEIGSFLKLVYNALYVEEISQYEVERMLLMPKESTTLATLMTSMLSPQVMRSQLDSKAVMPYEIWTFRLKRRIDHWLSVFYICADEIEAFNKCGVEPLFWTCIGLMNPLEDSNFHEIPFCQRVWIFKSLCNNLMHSDKPIQDLLLDSSNSKELRPIRIGGDKRGNIYFRIPFFREIRVYKQARLPDVALQAVNQDDFLANIIEATNEISYNEEEKELEFLPKKSDCLLVADSVESLTRFIQKLKDRKQLVLARNFSNQLKLVKNERRSIEGLFALYTQWHEYQNRSQEYFAHILNLWLSTEKKHPENSNYFSSNADGGQGEVILGKRQSKQNRNYDFACIQSTDDSEERSSDYDSSDVSDWESTYKNKKKKKLESKKKRKRASSESNFSEGSNDGSKQDPNSTLSIQKVLTLNDHHFEEEKLDINEMQIKTENGNFGYEQSVKTEPIEFPENNSVLNSSADSGTPALNTTPSNTPNSLPPVPPGYMIVPVIKKEKEDVICISSDEDEDVNTNKAVTNVNPTQNRNGIPPLSVIQTPTIVQPIRTPSPQKSVIQRTRNIPQQIPVPQGHVPHPLSQGHAPQSMSQAHVPQPMPQVHISHPLQVPQPIPVSPMPQPITPSPRKFPLPIPAPSTGRQMPLPIPEPPMPQPILEPPMPQPIPQAGARAQGWPSPRAGMASPRQRMISPRMRSPLTSPTMRTPSPRGPSPLRNSLASPVRPVRGPAVRNLFPQVPAVPTVEGVLEIGQKPDGSYGYHVRLPDGGIINMSRIEIDEIRKKNNGVLPVKIEVPLTKNKKF